MSSHRLRYPYNWARGQVQGFVEKYARGTYFLARLVDLTPGEIRMKLTMTLARGNSLRFESFKRAIKYLEDYSNAEISRFTPEERRLLLKWIVYLSEDDVLDEKSSSEPLDNLSQRKLSF